MAACPRCGSFLVAGTTCEVCSRWGLGSTPQPQGWQTPQYQAQPQYAPAPSQGGYRVDTGINLLELDWARTRVMWAWLLIGGIGLLSVGAYWVITRRPDLVGQLMLGLLLQGGNNTESQRTALDILEFIIGFVLSWLPFTGLAIHGMGLNQQSSLAQLADVSPLLWQGLVYLALAVMIWRRSIAGLAGAALLFLADSGIYGYGIFRAFQQLYEAYQKYQEVVQTYPSLATGNSPYEISHWPWGLVVPIIVRLAILWFLVTSFSAMGTLRLHHQRLKAAKAEAQAQSLAA